MQFMFSIHILSTGNTREYSVTFLPSWPFIVFSTYVIDVDGECSDVCCTDDTTAGECDICGDDTYDGMVMCLRCTGVDDET